LKPQDEVRMRPPEDHYECATCGQIVYMGDLAAVLFHEHRGITDRVDLSSVEPGVKLETEDD
jgi:hypothetical protein